MFMFGLGRRLTGRTFAESLKALEADVQHANALAAEFPREYHGTCLQMRLSYSPAAQPFLFLFRWADCCSLAGSLGLLRILIYKVYADGRSTMRLRERKASVREFYGVIYPALQQLQGAVTYMEKSTRSKLEASLFKAKNKEASSWGGGDRRGGGGGGGSSDWTAAAAAAAATLCGGGGGKPSSSSADLENPDQECGICMEVNTKIVLPGCNHAMCIACFRDWHARSQSCPFCRDSLKRVSSRDLWIFTDCSEIADVGVLLRDDLLRLFMFIDKLPVLVSSPSSYSSRVYDDRLK
ncbi:hypothetical protein CBR_g54820 [Chara braunii]|uniref:RING-type domain-containing protein n=1 Tax=Chara braunii TaxID=69332 RepID=A0A388JPJ7_CHABU|nr:hypothetical protein CBR_g54820 [Chara braunii]|eukprot:GBG59715.1 hypothetical protein CBR_g54820 [Chara braunii]